MKNRLLNVVLTCSVLSLAAATPGAAEPGDWTRVSPPGAGFSVDMTGMKMTAKEPGQYVYLDTDRFFAVIVTPPDGQALPGVDARDQNALEKALEAKRAELLAEWKPVRQSEPVAGLLGGYPTLRFSMEAEGQKALTLLVSDGQRMYQVVTTAETNVPDADGERFLRSFRLDNAKTGSR